MSSPNLETIVLTAASGKQCKLLIPLLLQNPRFKLRLVVNSSSSASKLQAQYCNSSNSSARPRSVEIIQANLLDTTSCSHILTDATTIYHINPNHPKEAEIGINMVSAAIEETKKPDSKLKHFILSTVYCTQLSKMLNHARKLKVEERLIESAAPGTGALNWTIIQPGHLAEALIDRLITAMNETPGEYVRQVPFEAQFNTDIPFSFLSLQDLAAASAKTIEQRENHYFATYGLSSTFPMPYEEFIRRVGVRLGVTFDVRVLSYEKGVDANCSAQFGKKDVDQATRDGSERLVLFYNKRGLLGNPNICSWILERETTGIEDMVDNLL